MASGSTDDDAARAAPPGSLCGECADVWYASTQSVSAELATRQLALLSQVERARHDRRRTEPGRAEFRVAHALLRTSLSHHLGPPPESWRFETGEHGRPLLVGPASGARARFSLSHTSGLVACALTLDHAIGIDVENAARPRDVERIVMRMFAPSERADVLGRSGDARRARFLDYWTLKEAHLKALGTGMTTPMREIAFQLGSDPGSDSGEGEAIRVSTGDGAAEAAAAWQHFSRRVGARHHLAVAVRAPRPVSLRLHAWTP